MGSVVYNRNSKYKGMKFPCIVRVQIDVVQTRRGIAVFA